MLLGDSSQAGSKAGGVPTGSSPSHLCMSKTVVTAMLSFFEVFQDPLAKR